MIRSAHTVSAVFDSQGHKPLVSLVGLKVDLSAILLRPAG